MSEQPAETEPETPVVTAAREVEQHVAETGWDQPPQLFALVATDELIAMQPQLADQVDIGSTFTPIAQDPLPADDVADALAGIVWPDAVAGCALAQEIVIAPDGEDGARREARLVAAVLRDGPAVCALRLRDPRTAAEQELIESPELAPNLVAALRQTFDDEPATPGFG